MLYKFKSKATGDVIMLGPNGDAVMRLVNRESTAKGIFEVQHLPQLIATLEKAVTDDDACRRQPQADDEEDKKGVGDANSAVGLRQRVWPLVEMMRRSLAHSEPIVWGV
jgi:hypothetical protein